MRHITKDQLLKYVNDSLLFDKPVECSFELLRFAFGFKRISGEEFMITKLFRPSVTEESMSYLHKDEIVDNVLDWAKENGFACWYNGKYSINDSFTFHKLIPKQQKED